MLLRFITFSSFLLLIIQVPHAVQETYPPSTALDEIQTLINQVPKSHPRLLINQEGFDNLRESIKTNPLKQKVKEVIIKQANMVMDDTPIKRELQGRRLLGKSRTCVQRVLHLAMAYQLTGEQKYVDRCKKEMLAAANFKDWNPSHFLDVAEMTFALAIGYDWLYDQLDDDSRLSIRNAILQKGVTLPFETEHNRWVRATNNWGQVCHAGLTAGALAVVEHEPELAAKTVHNALQNVTRSMKAFAPNGSYPEGPGYWSYGTTYNVLLNAVLEGTFHSDFGLSKAPGFSETGQYLSLVTGPSGYTFNYADGGAGRNAEPAVFWFASKFNRSDWVIQEFELLSDLIEQAMSSENRAYGGRFFPLTLVWMGEKSNQTKNQLPLHWKGNGEVPITIHRSAWDDPNAVFVGFKAGSPSANHGNMDTGSFVLDADGERWAHDLGAESYHGIESRGMNLWDRSQDSDRWTIFRQQNHSHNTLVIDNQLQTAKNAGEIIEFSDDESFPYTVMDLTPVYEGQASSIKRGITVTDANEVIIQDELEGLKPGSIVRWGMVTKANTSTEEMGTIHLTQNGKSLTVKNSSPSKDSKWEITDLSQPQNEWDSPNKGASMVTWKEKAPESGKLNITMVLTPGSAKQSSNTTWINKSLDQWENN